MNKKNLYIIGNGFDLAHNLDTSFSSFKAFIKDLSNITEDDEELFDSLSDFDIPYINIDDIEPFQHNVCELAIFFYKFINTIEMHAKEVLGSISDNWGSFEELLGYSNEINWDLDHLKLHDTDGDWDFIHSVYNFEDFFENFSKSFNYLVNFFFRLWIKTIYDNTNFYRIPKKRKDIFNNNSLYLTFNYTTVLEDTYNIKQSNICHIHGNFVSNESLTIGHGRVINEDIDLPFNPKYYDSEVISPLHKPTMECFKKHISFFKRLKDIENIYFIGFNLSNKNSPDKYYFEKIFSSDLAFIKQNINIYFDEYYWSHNQIDDSKNTLIDWGLKNKEFKIIR